MMKSASFPILLSLAALLVCSPGPCAADPESTAAGHWEGAIVLPTGMLDISVDLARGGDGAWQGAIDIPAQGLHGFGLSPVKVDGPAVTFGMPGVPGGPLFAGQLSGDAKAIRGDFTQGGSTVPFKLDRKAKPAPVRREEPKVGVPGKGPEGSWQGFLKPLPSVELRLALDVTHGDSGTLAGVLVSIDQGNARIPITTFSERDGTVHFEAASVGGVFDGKLNGNGSEIAGDWSQAGLTTPLVFVRLAPEASSDESKGSKNSEPGAAASSSPGFKWLVLKPIPIRPAGSTADPDETAQRKAFAADLLASLGGETAVRPQAGARVSVNGAELEWKAAEVKDDQVSLNSVEARDDFQAAYAWTEFDVPSDKKALLGVGSDDGVRVWLNGLLVHDHWIARTVQKDDDIVPVTLKAGRNRLLLKVQNITGSWGFACRLVGPDAVAGRMVSAAKAGDLDALKGLAGRGFDLNVRTSDGLTPFIAARMWGQKGAADFLAKQGADTGATPPATEALVDTLLTQRISKDGAGAVVLVARNGKILFEKAYGLADIARNIPATVDTQFRIGSITKQFTASGILRLQEAGKLRITDALSKYYPDFPRGGEVTLQRLLTHTSGIHSYTDTPGFLGNVTRPTSTSDLIASIEKFPFDFSPGERWSYCNSGFVILGDIIQRVSGKEYGDFLNEMFFAPLGMTASGEYRNDRPPPRAAVGYSYEDGTFKKALDWDMSWAGGAGSIYSTVGDLYLWNEAVFGGRVLGKEDLAAAFTPVITEENKNDRNDDGYGYGWVIGRFRGAREISHGGGLHGFLSNLLRLPDQNFTVVVLENESPPKPRTAPGPLSREIAEYYLASEILPPPRAPAPTAVQVPGAALAAIVGNYDYPGAILFVTQEGDRLFGRLGARWRFELFALSETEFFLKGADMKLTFVRGADGRIASAVIHQGGQIIHAQRIEKVEAEIKLEDARTEPLLGDYEFKPLGKMTISREAGRMYEQLTGQDRLELGASSETEFFLRVVHAQLTFVKGADGKVTKVILHQGGQDYEMPRTR